VRSVELTSNWQCWLLWNGACAGVARVGVRTAAAASKSSCKHSPSTYPQSDCLSSELAVAAFSWTNALQLSTASPMYKRRLRMGARMQRPCGISSGGRCPVQNTSHVCPSCMSRTDGEYGRAGQSSFVCIARAPLFVSRWNSPGRVVAVVWWAMYAVGRRAVGCESEGRSPASPWLFCDAMRSSGLGVPWTETDCRR
jgi:hypothetical protein